MTRIIGGALGGRTIGTPRGRDTRPTSDRVREALFSRLDHLDAIDGARVADLYAGSGALGLEALSRGAAGAVFVESHRGTARLIERNAADLGVTDLGADVDVRAEPVERVVAASAPVPSDLVLIDPPYALGDDALRQVLEALTRGWLTPDALVVVERSSRSPEPTWPAALKPLQGKAYGETTLWYADLLALTTG